VKILFLTHRLPFPPNHGAKIRPFHLIKHLGRRHEVTVASLIRSAEEARASAKLRIHCSSILAARTGELRSWWFAAARVPTRTPLSIGYFHSPRLAALLRTELARHRYDLIWVHCSSVARYLAAVSGITKVLDFCDMDSQKWLAYAAARRFPLSMGYRLEGRRLERTEGELLRRFDLCTCSTPAELETLRSHGAATPIDWFPNGVDSDYFAPADTYNSDTICFVGNMAYFPNQQSVLRFCADVLPALRAHRPGIRFLIVGSDPSRAIRRLADGSAVVVTGSVADVRPYVRSAALSVAPLQIARGTLNKVLESLAMGVPVVASPAAMNGIDATPGEHLLIANGPHELLQAILRLLDDRRERQRLAAAGRARMLSHHTWERSMQRVDHLLERCRMLHADPSTRRCATS
jgi:sugar transferase (PEP-CTERM/EpsH1 system associated)